MNETNDTAPDGLAQLRALMASERKAPLLEKMDIRLVEVERGQVVFEGTPDRSVYNPLGSVHGGYAATMLDSACGIAAHSTQGPNRGHTTLELKVSYLRALDDRSGTVRAVGRTISVGRRVAFTEATLHDGEGRLCATATSTILVFDVEPTKRGALQT
ncbi:PaaI family thioesterase [Novosphingobium sp. KCTC 2891]|uniref:PaaI family thioesterase n=1 Tax=Novosphingobium sp. KCTC 2891 TaxID=2989730 RepID=UPI002222098B|nr:PaaI family thioesterase [Novosphingobium sp. KCTC 2891]MCW1383717.1 PaaI family thioesterase [Novosphingobium sp. KCTC 2891]